MDTNDQLREARRRLKSPSGSGRPMSVRELADAVSEELGDPIDEKYVAKLERGVIRWPSAARRRAFQNILRVETAYDLGFYISRGPCARAARTTLDNEGPADDRQCAETSSTVRSLAPDTARGDTGVMQRRRLLATLLPIAVAATMPSPFQGMTFMHSAADWDEITWEYGYAYLGTAKATLLGDLWPDLVEIQAHLALARDESTRRRLAGAAARLAGLAAWAHTHLGQAREARHTWRLGAHLAEESADLATRAWVSGQEILAALYLVRPAPILTKLVDQTAHLRDGRTAGAVRLNNGVAQALADLGRPDEAIDVLQRAFRLFELLPVGETKDHASFYSCQESRLLHARAYVYSKVGTAGEADTAIDDALATYPEARRVSRAQLELHRAVAMVRYGDIDGATQHASSILQTLPSEDSGQLVYGVARDVLAEVPTAGQNRPNVKALNEHLRAIRYVQVEVGRG
jgi:tetratricopeptide (TPR) repeat protein